MFSKMTLGGEQRVEVRTEQKQQAGSKAGGTQVSGDDGSDLDSILESNDVVRFWVSSEG